MCPDCEEYAVPLEIHGPTQLRRIVGKIQAAISEQRLQTDDSRSDQALVAQTDFAQLDLSRTLPDVMIYHINCRSCGQKFKLQCECYHGAGGSWSCE